MRGDKCLTVKDATAEQFEKKYCFTDPMQPWPKVVITHRLFAQTFDPKLPLETWEGQCRGMLQQYINERDEKTGEKTLLDKKKVPTLEAFIESKIGPRKPLPAAEGAAAGEVAVEDSAVGGDMDEAAAYEGLEAMEAARGSDGEEAAEAEPGEPAEGSATGSAKAGAETPTPPRTKFLGKTSPSILGARSTISGFLPGGPASGLGPRSAITSVPRPQDLGSILRPILEIMSSQGLNYTAAQMEKMISKSISGDDTMLEGVRLRIRPQGPQAIRNQNGEFEISVGR